MQDNIILKKNRQKQHKDMDIKMEQEITLIFKNANTKTHQGCQVCVSCFRSYSEKKYMGGFSGTYYIIYFWH